MPEIQFLQPFFLWFLPLALLPLFLLLLLRRRYREQPFGSLLFLRRIWEKRKRTLRLQELILWLLRTLILLLIISFFARPLLHPGTERSVSIRSSSHILVLDNSFSMRLREGNITLLDKAKSRAADLLHLLSASSECAVLSLVSPSGNWENSPGKAAAQIQGISATCQSGDYAAVSAELFRLASRSRQPGIAVYVFSDFAASTLDSLRFLRPAARTGKQFDWTFIQVSSSGSVSAWPEPAILVPRSTGIDGRLELRTGISSTAAIQQPPVLEAHIGSQILARRPVSVGSGSQRDSLVLPLRSSGSLEGKIVIDASDDLPEDNRWYFNFFNPPTLRVAVLADGGMPPLLQAMNRATVQGAQPIRLEVLSSQSFLASKDSYDAVWLLELGQPPAWLKDALRSFLVQGKGVIITLGPNADPALFNRILLGPLGLGQLVSPRSGAGFHMISRLKTRNPLFSGFPPHLREEVLFERFFEVQPSPQSNVLAEMDDGSPFLMENRTWGGALLLMAGSLRDTSSTNMAQSAFAIPFLHRCIEVVCNALRQGAHFRVGEPICLPFGKGQKLQDPLVWIDAKGTVTRFPVASVARPEELRLPPVSEAGNYRLARAPGETLIVSVNIDRAESDSRSASAGQIRDATRFFPARWIAGTGDFSVRAKRLLRGRDLSLLLLVGLALALAAEMYVSKRISN